MRIKYMDAVNQPRRQPFEPEQKPLVAIFDSSEEIGGILIDIMQMEGFATISGKISDLRNGRISLEEVLGGQKPDVIVYDVVFPYEQSWEYLKELKGKTEVIGDARFILTTTNKAAV